MRPDLIVSSPALVILLTVNRFYNKVAPNVPNDIRKNSPFCPFASFSIVLLASVINIDININKPDYLTNVTAFIIFSIFLFEIINVVLCCAKYKERSET